ncbi:MAG: hypothetical protein WC761_00170 [Candidatus Paceibacterota bacterium]|jgi:hypothetical protein
MDRDYQKYDEHYLKGLKAGDVVIHSPHPDDIDDGIVYTTLILEDTQALGLCSSNEIQPWNYITPKKCKQIQCRASNIINDAADYTEKKKDYLCLALNDFVIRGGKQWIVPELLAWNTANV